MAPSAAELSLRLEVPEPGILQALEGLAAEHCLVLQPGTHSIWMAHPFSGIATDFAVSSGGRTWFANCVWDGLAILALFGDGSLDTHSPASGAPLRFEVRDRSITGEGLVHFLVPAAEFWADIGYT